MRKGICGRCNKKSVDLVWSPSLQCYVDWDCMKLIMKEKNIMEGKDNVS